MKRRSFQNLRSTDIKLDESISVSFNPSLLDESPQRGELSKLRKDLAEIIPGNVDSFLYLEMFLYYGEILFEWLQKHVDRLYPFQNLHLIPQNHPEYFRNYDIDRFYLKRVTFLMQPFYSRKGINSLWRNYLQINPQVRMFDGYKGEDGVEWVTRNPSCIRDDKSVRTLFKNIIDDRRNLQLMIRYHPFALDVHKDSKMVLKPNQSEDIIKNKGMEPVSKKLRDVYPDYMFKDKHHFLITDHIEKVIKKKKSLQDLNAILRLKETAEQLAVESGDSKWIDLYNNIELKKIDYRSSGLLPADFKLDELTHVIGRLGAGKSILTKLVTKNVTQHGKKVLILENDVLKCFKLMNELKELGIKAAVFLGDSSIQRHREDYAASYADKASDLLTFFAGHEEQFKILSDFNYTHEYLKQHFEHTRKPRNQMIEMDLGDGVAEFIAPDYSFNGDFEKYRLLAEADVWIGNYDALLLSKVPYHADLFERNYFTLGWLRSDLIIVDEYDLAQQRFDNALIQELNLVTDKTEKRINFLDYMYNVVTEIKKSGMSGFVGNYADAISISQRLGRYLYSQLFPQPVIRDQLKNKTFTMDLLVSSFTYEFIQECSNVNDLEHFLVDFLNLSSAKKRELSPTLRLLYEDLTEYYMPRVTTEFGDEDPSELRDRIIVDLLAELQDEYHIVFKKDAYYGKDFSSVIKERLDLLLAFSIFDRNNRFLINEYQTFMMLLEEENKDLIGSFSNMVQVKSEPYYSAPLLNDVVAYRFSSEDEKNDKLKMLYYFGVGRNLLSRMQDTFLHIEPVEKPAMLLLSATSYVPGSSVYHTKIKPKWLLSNRSQKEQKIQLDFCPVKDKDFSIIKVSGKDDIFKKENALKKIVDYFVSSGKFEDDFIRMAEEYSHLPQAEQQKGKQRIIAFPVFSFEVAEVLGRTLREQTSYNVRVQYQTGKYAKGARIEFEEGFHIRKNDLENLYAEPVDVFVFVANSVGRGLNILQGVLSKSSLIGTMYFLVRPYPTPDNFSEVVHQLHSSFEGYLEDSDKAISMDEPLYKYWYKVEGKVRGLYSKLMNKRGYWNSLTDENKKVITLNMLTLMYQTMGRGLRGGTDLQVYLVDAAFAPSTAEKATNGMVAEPNEERFNSSMLSMMEHLLMNESDFLMDLLFSPLKEAVRGKALITEREETYL
ncbi:hypothetical protein QNH36_22480 [Mesobacillus sp. AQ2]|uniref:hypothetical protein n=1 Tax=Mesobacillus sp. AQ2 TaxID=3043332 RepID=UPI0024C20162|nr:hypothetical protein [Mesobacillus sp. AQ2]WHX40374.1 hypothetical protein QNH36_22480 [Mesobacillus sp. AQ2]